MKRLIFAGLVGVFSAGAAGQAIHHGFIWLEGPEGVLAPNSTYTVEAWGMWDSPVFVPGVSAMAGFGVNVINTAGSGSEVVSVGNVQIAWWASVFGDVEGISGTDLIGVSGGTVPPPIGTPVEPHVNYDNPLVLFTFDFVTGDTPIRHVAFTPTAHEFGLGFYIMFGPGFGESIFAPRDDNADLTLTGWEYVVPSPATVAVFGLALLGRRRRTR